MSMQNSSTRFYSGINTRNRGSNVSTENDEPIGIVDTLGEAQPTTASQSNSFEHLESEAEIIAHDVKFVCRENILYTLFCSTK